MHTSQSNSSQSASAFVPFTISVSELGFNLGTARNWLCQGKFPLPIFRINGLNFVKRSDLIRYSDDPATKFEGSVSNSNLLDTNRRTRGRPPKKFNAQIAKSNSQV